MTGCEMCGSTKEPQVSAVIEGTQLTVCEACGRFGKVLRQITQPQIQGANARTERIAKNTTSFVPEKHEVIVPAYSQILRQARDKLGMTQKEFAQKICEKESVLQHYETGKLEPSLEQAKRLEKILNIKLIERHSSENMNVVENLKSKKTGGLTIGDMLKI